MLDKIASFDCDILNLEQREKLATPDKIFPDLESDKSAVISQEMLIKFIKDLGVSLHFRNVYQMISHAR